MKVLKFSYEFNGHDELQMNSLIVGSISLKELNLLVGRNASGKSTAAFALWSFAEMIQGTSVSYTGKFSAELELEPGIVYKYIFSQMSVYAGEGEGITEQLSKNGISLLERSGTSGKIYSDTTRDFVEINPPPDKLIHQVRRDEKEYPYLEDLVRWAESTHFLKFGHVHSASSLPGQRGIESVSSFKDKDFDKILGGLTDESKKKIIEEFNSLGYNVTLMNIKKENGRNIISVKENGVKYQIDQGRLSQGMFRSLLLLIFLYHVMEKQKSQLIIIDDLCEGLDYDRATRLGKLIFQKMKEKGVQFVATSNDYFLMNVVDIEYWNIIYREGDKIKSRNYTNSKEKFDSFKLTGLSNFDLYSSNFLD